MMLAHFLGTNRLLGSTHFSVSYIYIKKKIKEKFKKSTPN